MLLNLILLLTILPVLELMVLLRVHAGVSGWLGSGWGLVATVGSILATGVAGAMLARRQGLETLTRIQESLARGKIPARPVVDGGMILVGGALLLTPGFITDAIGLSLLIPWTRSAWQRVMALWIRRRIERGEIRVEGHINGASFGSRHPTGRPGDPDVVETTYRVVDPGPGDDAESDPSRREDRSRIAGPGSDPSG